MRHARRRFSFGRKPSHLKATVKHLATALIRFQRIETTVGKAKEARRLVERLITIGKTDDLTSRRMAFSMLNNREVVLKLFKDVAPLFKDRTSGFTRIIPFGFRKGDGACMAILEFTEKKMIEKPPKKAKQAKKEAPAEGPREEEKKPEEPKTPKSAPKAKPTMDEEKAREKARAEEKKVEGAKGKGFLQNLRGRFRKRGTDR